MMAQRIGNVGILNLLNATEESVRHYESIGNVGMVLYRSGQSHLLAALSIGNIGKTVEVLEGYNFYQGDLLIDRAYLQSLEQQPKTIVMGTVVIALDVEREQLEQPMPNLIVHGDIYAPSPLKGIVSQRFSEGSPVIKAYEKKLPRMENGNFTLSNSFLYAAEEPIELVVNGVLALPMELDMNLFEEKISKLEINGVINLHEEQETAFYKKLASSVNGVVNVIPAGYEVIKHKIKLNSRSIRSFRRKKVQTKKPILLEADISREAFESAFEKIDSKSFIVCSEEIEDLVYERLDRLDTEVLSYPHQFVVVEGEQEWSNEHFLGWNQPVNLIVEGLLSLNADVTVETIQQKLAAIDLFGEIQVVDPQLKGALQSKIRAIEGQIKNQGETVNSQGTGLQNIGELSL
ncbi:hypothetical protein [Planococcus sp. YIM B11945]|uniref:hypothetical protein n=1 Tax=Planococcus sp. YIM B11945 TaxID=3435410 RepID=UPI003D7D3BEB